jgi:uncharacterized membrane protein
MPPESADRQAVSPVSASARTKLLVSFGAAIAGGTAAAVAGAGRAAPLIGWDILAVILLRVNLKYIEAALALVSVFVSWILVHTVFALKYARLYYAGTPGGIDFNEAEAPDYADFAYLSFTIGMTFQVSDTKIETKQIRRTALRHAWLSFPLGAVIIATSINLVSGLAK